MALQYPDTSMGIHTCLVILYNSGGVYQDVQFIYSLSLYYGTQYARQIFAILERERKRIKGKRNGNPIRIRTGAISRPQNPLFLSSSSADG